MRRVFKRRLWVQVIAIVLAMALNLGVFDGLIRFTVHEWKLGTFDGFLGSVAAKPKNVEAQKNRNTLPDSAGPKEHKNPVAEEAKENREVKEKRTPNAKTYRVGKNEYRTEVFRDPVHYTNEKNELVDIDNTLVDSTEKGYAFENKANSFKVRFAGKSEDKKLGQIQQKDIFIKWYLSDGKEVAGDTIKNTITYSDIKEKTDLRYVVEGSALKEDIILKSHEAPTEFKFVLNTKSLKFEALEDGSINFIDSRTNEVVWVMPKPFMYDAKGGKSEAVTATLENKWGKLVLTVKADEEWITSVAREFPIVIDPTLQPGERFGRDTFISSTYHDTNFNSDEKVYVGNTPEYGDTIGFFFFRDITREENVKITDATFSLYSDGGGLSSVKLQEVLIDWVWDHDVLTWDFWQGRRDLGHEVLGDFTVTERGSNGWWSYDIKELVQKWVDNPVKNVGFALLPSGSGYRKFISSNYGTTEQEHAYHPMLEYTYTIEAPEVKPADFTMHIDRKKGSVTVDGRAKEDAKIYLSTSDGGSFTANADSSGKWKKTGLNFEDGKIKTVSMYYTYEVEVTDEEGNTHTETRTSDTTKQDFLITRYSKGARMAKMAKLYYYDGSKAGWLKEVNGIKNELEMVVGDWVLVLDPRENRPYTGGEIITDPDEEYRLREKLRPLYNNGEVVGDSIDAATGNFFVFETDLAFDAPGMPIEFIRFFNTQEPENYRGPLSQNWHMSYDKMIVKYEDGSILAAAGDGGGYFFRPSGSGYVSDKDVTNRLVKNGDGTYSVIAKYNTVYHFNKDGMLDRITDRNNNSVTLSYDDEGLLRTVSDVANRTVRLYYDYLGRIILMEDPEGRQVEYDYDSWGRLLQVIDLNGGVTKYEYGRYTPKGHFDNLRITKITDPMGYEAVKNTYDDLGRVKTQVDAEVYDVNLEYSGNTTTFTDKNKNKFVYKFDDKYRVLSIAGPAVETGMPDKAQPTPAQTMKFGSVTTASAINSEVTTPMADIENVTVTSTAGSQRTLVEYHYDSNGYRDQVKDAMGHVMYYDYDDRGNLESALDGKGKGNRYEYNDSGNRDYPTDIFDALDHKTHIKYDDHGNILSTTNAKDETTYYTYFNNTGLVETITDPVGKQVKYSYNPDGTMKSVKDGRDNYTYFYYDNVNRLKKVEYPKGSPAYYEYDDYGNLVREYSYIDGKIVETVNSYDYNNNLTGAKDSEENINIFRYNKRGELVEDISPLGNTEKIEYDGNGNRRKLWDAENNLTEYRYNERGWLKKIIEPSDKNPAGDVTEYYYDANGKKIAVEDPLEKLSVYKYDDLDRLEMVTDAVGRTANYTYDDLGNVLNYKDFDNTYTDYQYDKLSRVEQVLVNDQYRTKYTYDRSGNIETVTNPMDKTYIYRYDDNNNLWQVEDSDNNIVEFGYDKNNNRESVKDPMGNITEYHYDDLNRPYEIVDPLDHTTSFTLNKNGQREAVTDGNKHTTKFQYDADGRLQFVFDAKQNMTEYKYDKAGNLRFFWDANRHKTEYKYNSKNLLIETINHLNQKTVLEYDENGNIKAKTDAKNNSIEYDYDDLNRLQGIYYPDGNYVEYGYNEKGKREWMEDMYGTAWYDYDDMGWLRYVTNQDEMTVEYDYNDLGQKTLVRYPDGKEVNYTYDNLNRLKTVKDRFDKVTTYEYDKASRRTKTTLPNGVVTSYDYDKASQLRLIETINEKNKRLAKYEYDYDDAGNRKSFSQTVGDSVYTTQYFYDPLNQLENVINPDGSQVGYKYDPVGNRDKMTRVEGNIITTTKYEYNEVNELSRYNVNDGPYTEFRYDNNGNRTAKIEPGNRVTSYAWDYENRLTELRFHQDKWVGFEYDGDGNRITKLSAMTMPSAPKHDNGIGNDPGFVPPGQEKAKKQQAGLIYALSKGGGGGGSGGGGGNGGGNSGGNSGKDNNGKEKSNNGKADDKPKNKDLDKEGREKKKEQAKAKQGYRKKGKYTNRGKHKGWYKNSKIPAEKVDVTYYLNDVSEPLTQVLMTYGEDGKYNAAYTYGLERIEVEAVDETRPESQDPLYYLYDGLGSVTYMVKPDGNIRDHYRYDEFGKPAPGNTKLSEDGQNNLHNTFGYTGEMWDEESNLLYLRARYYEPETGRFLGRDIYKGNLENPLSRNLSSYVLNNPINFIDPYGLRSDNAEFLSDPKYAEVRKSLAQGKGGAVKPYSDKDFNRLDAIAKQITDLGNLWNKTKSPQVRVNAHALADELRIEKYQIKYWNTTDSDVRADLQAKINGIRKAHGWSRGETLFYNPNGSVVAHKKYNLTATSPPSNQGTGKTGGSTQIFNPNPGINTTACHISNATGVPMNQVTINPDNPGYKYTAGSLAVILGTLTGAGAYSSLAPAAAGTGTVWDKITPTAANITNTNIPATFQMNVAGRTLWVNANATEHMGEYLARGGSLPSSATNAQAMLTSFRAATEQAMQTIGSQPAGRYFGTYGGWELGINTETGVIFHALMK